MAPGLVVHALFFLSPMLMVAVSIQHLFMFADRLRAKLLNILKLLFVAIIFDTLLLLVGFGLNMCLFHNFLGFYMMTYLHLPAKLRFSGFKREAHSTYTLALIPAEHTNTGTMTGA